jgi:hypothetical protein
MLGIPNMIDRLLQQQAAEWLDYGASKSFPLTSMDLEKSAMP